MLTNIVLSSKSVWCEEINLSNVWNIELDTVPIECVRLETFGKPETKEEIWYLFDNINISCSTWKEMQGLDRYQLIFQGQPALIFLLQLDDKLEPYLEEYERKTNNKTSPRGLKGALDFLKFQLAHPEMDVPQYTPSSKANDPRRYRNPDGTLATEEQIKAMREQARGTQPEQDAEKEATPAPQTQSPQPQPLQNPANPTPPAPLENAPANPPENTAAAGHCLPAIILLAALAIAAALTVLALKRRKK